MPRRAACAVEVNGAELHLLEWGDPAAPPALLVHGMRGHARWFTPVGPALADRFRVLSVDLRGHGDSAHTPPYGHLVYAQDIAALIAHLDLKELVVVGHSMGGGVVVRAAPSVAGRLRGLVLVDAPLGPPPRPNWPPPGSDDRSERGTTRFASWEQARARFKLRPGEDGRRSRAHRSPRAPRAARAARRRLCLSLRPERRAVQDAGTFPPDASTIKCPVATIWGSESVMLKRMDPRAVCERFPSAAWTSAEIVEGAHHHVFIDRPEAFNDVLRYAARSHLPLTPLRARTRAPYLRGDGGRSVDVFAYLDYRAFLRDHYEARKGKGRGFSYRSFARKAG